MNTLEANAKAAPKYKAWRITYKGQEFTSIIGSSGASRAKYRALAQMHDAGFQGTFADIAATRAPEYDQWANAPGIARDWAVDESYVKNAATPTK